MSSNSNPNTNPVTHQPGSSCPSERVAPASAPAPAPAPALHSGPALSALESLAPELQRQIGKYLSRSDVLPIVTLASRACRQGFLAGVTDLFIPPKQLRLRARDGTPEEQEETRVASLARLLGWIPNIEGFAIGGSSAEVADRAVRVFALACRRHGRPLAKLRSAWAHAYTYDFSSISRADTDHIVGQLFADGFFPALTTLYSGLWCSRAGWSTGPPSLLLLWQQALERGHLSHVTHFIMDPAKDNDPVCNGFLNAPVAVQQRQAPVRMLWIKASGPITDACRERLEAMLRLPCFAQLEYVDVDVGNADNEAVVFAVLASYIRATGGAPSLSTMEITTNGAVGGLGPALVQALGTERGAPNLTGLSLDEPDLRVFADLGAIFAARGLAGLRSLSFSDPAITSDGSEAAVLFDGLRASLHRGRALETLSVDFGREEEPAAPGEIEFLTPCTEAFEAQFAAAQSAGAVANAKLIVTLPWEDDGEGWEDLEEGPYEEEDEEDDE